MFQPTHSHVELCLTCQQVKAEHHRFAGTLEPLPISVWTWDESGMHFMTGFPWTPIGQDSIWVVMDHGLLVKDRSLYTNSDDSYL